MKKNCLVFLISLLCFSSFSQVNDSVQRSYFTETELVDQNSHQLKFYSDLLKDKIVVIVPFCSANGADDILMNTFKALQEHFAAKLENTVRLIVITSDPKFNTPASLKTFADHYSPAKGWYFISGKSDNVETVMKKLGNYSEDPYQHNLILLLGNVSTGLWKKINGLSSKEEIIAILQKVIDNQ